MILVSLVAAIRSLNAEGFEIWLQRRTEDGPLDGLWEMPGGKWESHETPEEAGKREFKEEVGVEAGKLIPLKIFPFQYPDRVVSLHVYFADGETLELPSDEDKGWRTVRFSEPMKDLGPILEANNEIMSTMANYLSEESTQKHWRTFWV